jgi:sec-independent protein translocase protein TatA
MFGLRAQELFVILLIVLVLFGSSKIPEMMKGLGQGIKEFKKGMHEEPGDEKNGAKTDGTETLQESSGSPSPKA